MWKHSIPPQGLSASTYQTGYWTPVRSFDTIPMQALVFGTSNAELSQITGFSSNPEKTYFAVQYRDGGSKRIGIEDSGTENTTFNIDGKGGERITKVEVGMNSLPHAIKERFINPIELHGFADSFPQMTTNRGRHCFFGRPQKNSHTTYEPGDGAFVAGIYASWGYLSGEDVSIS